MGFFLSVLSSWKDTIKPEKTDFAPRLEARFSLKKNVNAAIWDTKAGRAIGRTNEVVEINSLNQSIALSVNQSTALLTTQSIA